MIACRLPTLNENHGDTDNDKHATLLHAVEVEPVVGQKGQGELNAREQEQVEEVDHSDAAQGASFCGINGEVNRRW